MYWVQIISFAHFILHWKKILIQWIKITSLYLFILKKHLYNIPYHLRLQQYINILLKKNRFHLQCVFFFAYCLISINGKSCFVKICIFCMPWFRGFHLLNVLRKDNFSEISEQSVICKSWDIKRDNLHYLKRNIMTISLK